MNNIYFLSVFLLWINGLLAQGNISSDSLKRHVSILASDSLEGRAFGSKSSAKAIEYITNTFIQAGIKPLNGTYLHPFGHKQGLLRIEGNNIIGIIEGTDSDLKSEYIIIGAHFDHLGWDDKDNTKIIFMEPMTMLQGWHLSLK